MRRNSIGFCKKGVTIVTQDAKGRVYTIIAQHIPDIIKDWQGKCDFVPCNDAPVHFAVYKGKIIRLPRNCDFETMMSMLAASQELRLDEAG